MKTLKKKEGEILRKKCNITYLENICFSEGLRVAENMYKYDLSF